MSVLGLSYENTTDDDEEEVQEIDPKGKQKEEGGGLVAYDQEEEEENHEMEAAGKQGEEASPPPLKRRHSSAGYDEEDEVEEEREENGTDESPTKRQRVALQEDDHPPRPSDEPEHRSALKRSADFEDQSSYPSREEGRSLMETMLPPRPTQPPDATLQRKIVEFHKLRRQGRAKSINEKIRHARNFKNPYMLNWLVSHCGIDETGSNYPKELFDPVAIRREAAEVMERQKREKQMAAAALQGRTTIDFTPGEQATTASVAPGLLPLPTAGMGVPPAGLGAAPRPIVKVVEGTKRSKPAVKSKWDQGDPASAKAATAATASRYAEYALQKKAEIEARLGKK